MRSTFKLAVVVCGLAAFQIVGLSAHAATVGYYRFENSPGFLVDSSPNSNHLTNTSATQYALPGTGVGSDFPNPVPLTLAANQHGASFGTTPSLLATANTGSDIISGNTMTAEAFFNFTGVGAGGRGTMVSQWDTAANDRSWMFSVESTGELSMFISTTGSSASSINTLSSFSPTPGVDYYGAATFETNGTTGGVVNFYLKNLDTGVLQTESVAHTILAFNHDDRLGIGSIFASNNQFLGTLDEVRVSDVVLNPNELLIFQTVLPPVPEPSSFGLLCCGLLALLRKSRRTRSNG